MRPRQTAAVLFTLLVAGSATVRAEEALAVASLSLAEVQLERLERISAEIRQAQPEATPSWTDTGAIRAELEAARVGVAGAEAEPGEARRLAEDVERRAGSRIRELVRYQADAEMPGYLEGLLQRLERREHAAVAAGEIRRARRSLAEARELYRRGHPSYAARLGSAQEDLDAAQARIDNADSEAFSLKLWLGFLVLVFSATVTILGLEARRVTRRCAKAPPPSTYSC